MYLTGDLTGPTLVIAPLRVARDTWTNEAAKWDQIMKYLKFVRDSVTSLDDTADQE